MKVKTILRRLGHGIGKSSVIKRYAKKHGEKVLNIRLSKNRVKDLKGLPKCNTDQFHWPYNSKPSMMKCEQHSAAMYIDGYFVNLITNAPEGTIEVVCHCCGHKIKEVKLDLAAADPRLQNFVAFKK